MANRNLLKNPRKKFKFEFSHQELNDLYRAIKWGIDTQKGNKELKEWAKKCEKIADMFMSEYVNNFKHWWEE